ncbi:hypothetical protein [Azospirillum himalayense]|uniref:Uncharacterized protein n=1 Tax=Azospirillum himalayense TaxID=654847 RepID=A0ABW0GBZ5_9PROT
MTDANIDVGVATAEELAQLAAHIEPGPLKDTISGWCIVAVRVAIGTVRTVETVLFGDTPEGRRWLTSAVIAVDLDRGLVRIRNSLYAVTGPSVEPSAEAKERITTIMMAEAVRALKTGGA